MKVLKNFLVCLISLLFVFSVLIPSPINALSLKDAFKVDDRGTTDPLDKAASKAGYNVKALDGAATPASILALIIQIFLSVLGIVFLVLIIYGGYLWMTAGGNEEQVTKAKDTLQAAIIGLIIVISAYAITYFVFNVFSGGGRSPVRSPGGTTGGSP